MSVLSDGVAANPDDPRCCSRCGKCTGGEGAGERPRPLRARPEGVPGGRDWRSRAGAGSTRLAIRMKLSSVWRRWGPPRRDLADGAGSCLRRSYLDTTIPRRASAAVRRCSSPCRTRGAGCCSTRSKLKTRTPKVDGLRSVLAISRDPECPRRGVPPPHPPPPPPPPAPPPPGPPGAATTSSGGVDG